MEKGTAHASCRAKRILSGWLHPIFSRVDFQVKMCQSILKRYFWNISNLLINEHIYPLSIQDEPPRNRTRRASTQHKQQQRTGRGGRQGRFLCNKREDDDPETKTTKEIKEIKPWATHNCQVARKSRAGALSQQQQPTLENKQTRHRRRRRNWTQQRCTW